MMERTVPAAARAEIERSSTPHALLGFLTIAHGALKDPVRVVSDVLDYTLDGDLYVGAPFGYTPVTDDESPATAEIRFQNVDRRIGAALLAMNSRARVTIDVRSSADFDLSQVPRVALPGTASLLTIRNFDLVDVSVNAVDVTGRLILRDYGAEPWPGLRATQSRTPGAFR